MNITLTEDQARSLYRLIGFHVAGRGKHYDNLEAICEIIRQDLKGFTWGSLPVTDTTSIVFLKEES